MRIYIAGAISNNPNYIRQFEEAEKRLLEQGHAVINPVKNDGFDYKDYIDMGLCELMKCEAIYLLEGWYMSKGANLEKHYAEAVGMQICYETNTEDSRTVVIQNGINNTHINSVGTLKL